MNPGSGAGRRDVLRGVTALTLGALAGCAGGDGADGEPTLSVEPNYGGWFRGVSNYKHNTKDRRGADEATIAVGVQANGGYLGFRPPAMAVSPGTRVTWDWTGNGGAHNVAAESGAFDSGDPARAGSTTFAHTFETPGVFKYVCEPHAEMGMKGAVFVALE